MTSEALERTGTVILALGLLAVLALPSAAASENDHCPGQVRDCPSTGGAPVCVSDSQGLARACYHACVDTNGSCSPDNDSLASVLVEAMGPGADVRVCVKTTSGYLC